MPDKLIMPYENEIVKSNYININHMEIEKKVKEKEVQTDIDLEVNFLCEEIIDF